jgi:transcriptional regulator with GAF, ATPase, and Fis domain
MEWPETSDAFLEYHLRGSSKGVARLRAGISAVNSNFNRDLIRGIRLQGESGTGKNHVARVISAHRQWLATGADPDSISSLEGLSTQFAEIGLQALPDMLVESELFGYKKGAFTGAEKDREGLLGGSAVDVLFDEVGDASPVVQAKLLGVIESRQFRKVGARLEEVEDTDARFIFATHHDLAERVRDGKFREDLYWRASEVVLTVSPLRDQSENLSNLIDYQMTRLLKMAAFDTEEPGGLRTVPKLGPEDLRWASYYQWPGNLRQLRHGLIRWIAVEGATSLADAVLGAESADVFHLRAQSAERTLSEGIERSIENARKARVSLAETLGSFVDANRRSVEQAIVGWYDRARPSPEELAQLFPGSKRSSITSKLSQWRNR